MWRPPFGQLSFRFYLSVNPAAFFHLLSIQSLYCFSKSIERNWRRKVRNEASIWIPINLVNSLKNKKKKKERWKKKKQNTSACNSIYPLTFLNSSLRKVKHKVKFKQGLTHRSSRKTHWHKRLIVGDTQKEKKGRRTKTSPSSML